MQVYSPITFGKKYKAEKYIRRFVPELKDVPDKFIYEPYTMTVEQQRKANCIIGKVHSRSTRRWRSNRNLPLLRHQRSFLPAAVRPEYAEDFCVWKLM